MVHHECPYDSHEDEIRAVPGVQVRAGDVYTVRESVFTPIYDLLRGCLDGDLQAQATAAYHAKLRVQTYKRRPCILMQDYPEPATTQMTRSMCLSGTLEKCPISSLPSVFQHFCIPIFPHPTTEDHIHSLPQWEGKDGWIIAIPFKSSRRLLEQWGAEHKGMPARTRAFGVNAMDYLKNMCVDKRVEWVKRCRLNPAYARDRFKECRDHKNPGSEKSTDAFSILSGVSQTSVRTYTRTPFAPKTNVSMTSLANALHKVRVNNSDKASVRSKASNFTLHRELLSKENANGMELHVF